MGAWNGWYHITGSTYGTWVRGDARGWREWHHHEHVEGDYRDPPPPGRSRLPREQSLRQMKGRAVVLNPGQRRAAGEAIVEKLIEQGSVVLALSLGGEHFHFLARFLDGQVRGPVGRAKKAASHVLRSHGLPGTVWAKRCGVCPIQDRAHQVNVLNYILDHAEEGAWTWHYRQPVPHTPRRGPEHGGVHQHGEGPPHGEGPSNTGA